MGNKKLILSLIKDDLKLIQSLQHTGLYSDVIIYF